jgi:hypothetical protein
MEHLIVVFLSILLLIPIINLFYSYSTKQTDEMVSNQVLQIGSRAMDNAETVYYMGSPSKITLDENFPAKIKNISILRNGDNYEFVFYLEGGFEVPFYSDVPIQGPFYSDSSASNLCKIRSDKGKACYSSGKKKLTVLAETNGNVSIIIK